MVAAIYKNLYGISLSKIEAANTGLLETFDEEGYCLDLPASKGAAALAFYRLLIQQNSSASLPRSFSDISENSVYYDALQRVGEAFLPDKRGRFLPNSTLRERDIFHATTKLVDRGILTPQYKKEEPLQTHKESLQNRLDKSAFESIQNKELDRSNPEPEFEVFYYTDESYKQRALNRTKKAQNLVNPEHLNEQETNNFMSALEGMDEVEEIFERLTKNLLEILSCCPETLEDAIEVKYALEKIDAALCSMIERFRYSLIQLKKILVLNPQQLNDADNLKKRLTKNIEEARVLKRKIRLKLTKDLLDEYSNEN